MTTTNLGLTQPASGSDVNTWAAPVNGNSAIIDNAFGGVTTVNVTGILGSASPLALTQAQVTPRQIVFTGTLGANLVYQVPAGIGGIWSVVNFTTGAFTISFGIVGGNALVLQTNQSQIISSTGTGVQYADTYALTNAATLVAAAVAGTTGTFTAAGIGGLPNATMSYLIVGKFCTLSLLSTAMIGTISGGAQGFSGLPSACRPANANVKYIPCFVTNNGVGNLLGQAQVSNSTQVGLASASSNANGIVFGGFTSGRSGGLAAGWTITYPLL